MVLYLFFFLMIRRPPRSTQSRSSAASDVYKRQVNSWGCPRAAHIAIQIKMSTAFLDQPWKDGAQEPVSYTHLRAHETVLDLVCRLLLEKKKKQKNKINKEPIQITIKTT